MSIIHKSSANDEFSHFINNEQHTIPCIIVISTKNEEKSLAIEKDFSVVPPSSRGIALREMTAFFNLSSPQSNKIR